LTDVEQKVLDKTCIDIVDSNINMAVPWYIMAAYAYYVEDDPILSDSRFDRLAKTMLQNWDKIEHMHKHLISESDLKAGTYLGEYPSRVDGAVKQIREIHFGKQKRS
jgi:hypothetical protein